MAIPVKTAEQTEAQQGKQLSKERSIDALAADWCNAIYASDAKKELLKFPVAKTSRFKAGLLSAVRSLLSGGSKFDLVSLSLAAIACARDEVMPGYEAYFLPFKDRKTGTTKIEISIDYKVLRRLVNDHARPKGGYIGNPVVVHKQDDFVNEEFYCNDRMRMCRDFRYSRNSDGKRDIGTLKCVYIKFRQSDADQEDVYVIDREDVINAKSASKAGDSGPWKYDLNAMSCKTIVRQISKRIFNYRPGDPDDQRTPESTSSDGEIAINPKALSPAESEAKAEKVLPAAAAETKQADDDKPDEAADDGQAAPSADETAADQALTDAATDETAEAEEEAHESAKADELEANKVLVEARPKKKKAPNINFMPEDE